MLSFLRHGPPVSLCMGLACTLSLWNTVSGLKGEGKKDKVMGHLPTTVPGNKGLKQEKSGSFPHAAESFFREEKMVKGIEVLATTELPARSVDLSALNLTELVNGMLSRALKADSKQFFSVLSITSYSSFAFHKVSLAIYNISNPKKVDPAKFPTRYCYCLNNRTNDLSDFTALLVDIVGNSTSYLTEIFKSTSILSVSQTNESDCVFICVMAGKSGRNLSDFWQMVEKSPVINYTFTSGVSSALGKMTRTPWVTSRHTRAPIVSMSTSQTMDDSTPGRPPWPSLPSTPASATDAQMLRSTESPLHPSMILATPRRLAQTSTASGTLTPGTQTPIPTKAPAPRDPQTDGVPAEWPFTPELEPALVPPAHQVSRCPRPLLKEETIADTPLPLVMKKLNPCLMELCRYFQKCLCASQKRDYSLEATRYCLEYYTWFLKNATLICQRVKRVSHSRTLKQKCLENVCKFV